MQKLLKKQKQKILNNALRLQMPKRLLMMILTDV